MQLVAWSMNRAVNQQTKARARDPLGWREVLGASQPPGMCLDAPACWICSVDYGCLFTKQFFFSLSPFPLPPPSPAALPPPLLKLEWYVFIQILERFLKDLQSYTTHFLHTSWPRSLPHCANKAQYTQDKKAGTSQKPTPPQQ